MATSMPSQAVTPDLCRALAAVQAAYERLVNTPRPDPRVLLDLERRTRELDAAAHRSAQAAHRYSSRTERRCAVAVRGADWIVRRYT